MVDFFVIDRPPVPGFCIPLGAGNGDFRRELKRINDWNYRTLETFDSLPLGSLRPPGLEIKALGKGWYFPGIVLGHKYHIEDNDLAWSI